MAVKATFTLLLLLSLPLAAQTYDKYGGLIGHACPANTSLVTPDVSYTITNVQRSGSTVTLTFSAAPSKFFVNAGLIVSGTAQDGGSFNTPAPLNVTSSTDVFTVTNVAGSTVSYTQGGNAINHVDSGTARLARPWVAQVGNQWFGCTPLGLITKFQGFFGVDRSNSTTFQGDTQDTVLATKFASGSASTWQLNWALGTANRIKQWNLNQIGVQTSSEDVKPMVTNASWSTSDSTIPTKLMTQVWAWPSHYAQANAASGGMTQNSKGFGNSVKLSVGATNLGMPASAASRGQIDVFDPDFVNYLHNFENDAQFVGTWTKGLHNDFLSYWLPDDTDGIIFSKAGVDFATQRDFATEAYPGSSAPHPGWMTLNASPFKTADTSTLNADINSVDVYSASATFYAKQEFANWLQGTTDQTTGVPAARSGSTVTLTFSNQNVNGVYLYVPYELISVSGCSDSTFNTVAGTGTTINTTGFTSGQIQYTLAGAGSSATGCQINSGPRYASIAALNTAWGTGVGGYDTFGTDATDRSDTICASSCSATTYNFTLTNRPLTPETLFVKVNNVIVAGSDGAGAIANPATATDNIVGGTISSGTVNTTSGVIATTFNSAPNAAVTATYKTGGWGSGHGFLDEDGTCPSKGAANCWIPVDALSICRTDYATNWVGTCTGDHSTAAMRNDLDNFLFHFAKTYFKAMRNEINIVSPGTLYGSTTNLGNWNSPVRRQVLQASQYYTDFISGTHWSGGVTIDQPRTDFVAMYAGNKPSVAWFGFQSNISSYYQKQCPINGGSLDCTNQPTTQDARGIQYQNYVKEMYSMQDSTYNVVHNIGFNLWRVYDQPGEGNWGWCDLLDNCYDGSEPATGVVACSAPLAAYNCGGEHVAFNAPYTGNFVGPASAANLYWVTSLTSTPIKRASHSIGGGRSVN